MYQGPGLTLKHINILRLARQILCIFHNSEWWLTNRGVFPVENDFRNAVRLLHHGVLAPVCTANCYHSTCVHAKI